MMRLNRILVLFIFLFISIIKAVPLLHEDEDVPDQIMMPSMNYGVMVMPPPNINFTRSSPYLTTIDSQRYNDIAEIMRAVVPKLEIDMTTSGTDSKLKRFDLFDDEMYDRIPKITIQPLESVARGVWSRRMITPPHIMRPRFQRPNPFQQRRHKRNRFESGPEISFQNGHGPHMRQRAFRLPPDNNQFGPRDSGGIQPSLGNNEVHPLENFDSHESFELQPPHFPFPVQQGNNPHFKKIRRERLRHEKPAYEPVYEEQDDPEPPSPLKATPPPPPPPLPRPNPPIRQKTNIVKIKPQVEEVKTIDGNRGVKTRVYTRITDVTTVGGDGDADNEVDEDDKMQRHDEPNIIDNIIDQNLFEEQKNPWVPYNPYVSKFTSTKEPVHEESVEIDEDFDASDVFRKRQDVAGYEYPGSASMSGSSQADTLYKVSLDRDPDTYRVGPKSKSTFGLRKSLADRDPDSYDFSKRKTRSKSKLRQQRLEPKSIPNYVYSDDNSYRDEFDRRPEKRDPSGWYSTPITPSPPLVTSYMIESDEPYFNGVNLPQNIHPHEMPVQQPQRHLQHPQQLAQPQIQQHQLHQKFPMKKIRPLQYQYPRTPVDEHPNDAYEHEDDTADRESEAFIDEKTRQLKKFFSDDEKDKVAPNDLKNDYLGVNSEPNEQSGMYNDNEDTNEESDGEGDNDDDSGKSNEGQSARSSGFFDDQAKFDFPKPDFGSSEGGNNWDNVFNGMTNNIDKSIKTMSDTNEDFDGDEKQTEGGNEEEADSNRDQQNDTHEPSPNASETPEYTDYEDYDGKIPRSESEGSETDAEGESGDGEFQEQDTNEEGGAKNSEAYDENDQGATYDEEYPTYETEAAEGRDDGGDGEGEGEGEEKEKDSKENADISEYEDYPESGRKESAREHNDNHFDPNGFEKYFQKLETGIEDEVQDGGPARSYEDYNPPEDNDPSYMDKTRQDDLSPEHHEGNDPESFDFKMPSHKELQEKYKTVSTSASELINHVVAWPGRTLSINEMRIQVK